MYEIAIKEIRHTEVILINLLQFIWHQYIL